MKLRYALGALLAAAALFTSSVDAATRDYLEREDVPVIMHKILKEHIDSHRVTPVIIQRSLKTYIDHFDPSRYYLLEKEVRPYLEISTEDAEDVLQAYRRGDFSIYEELNSVIQAAIARCRSMRERLEDHLPDLMEESFKEGAITHGLTDAFEKDKPFATDEAELFQRVSDDFIRFVGAQRLRVGEKVLEGKESKVLQLYRRRLVGSEKKYLFVDDDNESLSDVDVEHYMVTHILKALTASLDAHTAFFDAGEAYEMRVRLEKGFHGIGVVLQESIDGVTITKLIEGGPAEKSGEIKPNDRLVEIDGTSIVDAPFRTVLDNIRGKEGSIVTLGIKRKDQFFRVKIQRAQVVVREDRVDVEHRKVPGGIIGIIRLHSFYEGNNGVSSEEDIRAALKELHSKGRLKGLVLDLRENTGGFLNQAVKVAGLFISNGVVVVSKYSGDSERVFRDIDGYTYYNGPFVVMTSKTSASAAEIVAQALQDWGAAVVVGDKQTYGKGSIQHQTITNESSTSFYKVTVGRFYTVSGRSTQIRGVEADIVVPSLYHKEDIGEKFLDYPLANNRIEESYSDDLDDVEFSVRQWYEKYYIPSLQKKNNRWTRLLPTLRARSAKRLEENSEFQAFLGQSGDEYESALLKFLEDRAGEGAKDLQLDEGVNIVKDMIQLKEPRR